MALYTVSTGALAFIVSIYCIFLGKVKIRKIRALSIPSPIDQRMVIIMSLVLVCSKLRVIIPRNFCPMTKNQSLLALNLLNELCVTPIKLDMYFKG